MLIGEYQHNIDAKGRVIVPARFREDLGNRFYIAKGLDHCLFVFPPKEWQNLQDKVHAMPLGKARMVQRYFFAGAAEAVPDKQGRVLIPQALREHAGLDKDVTFIGASSRAEIWDTAKWQALNNSFDDNAIAEMMDGLDL